MGDRELEDAGPLRFASVGLHFRPQMLVRLGRIRRRAFGEGVELRLGLLPASLAASAGRTLGSRHLRVEHIPMAAVKRHPEPVVYRKRKAFRHDAHHGHSRSSQLHRPAR